MFLIFTGSNFQWLYDIPSYECANIHLTVFFISGQLNNYLKIIIIHVVITYHKSVSVLGTVDSVQDRQFSAFCDLN